MVVNEAIDIDLDRVDGLIEEEETKREPRHRASPRDMYASVEEPGRVRVGDVGRLRG